MQDTLQKVLDHNQAILQRLEEYDLYRGAEDTSIKFLDDDQSTIQPQGASVHGHAPSSSAAIDPMLENSVRRETTFNYAIPPQDFEITLEQTRVYMRVQSNNSDISFTSSAVRTNAWSMLSGLSLNDVSVISVIALPISLEEINRIGLQTTFSKVMSGTKESGATQSDPNRPPRTYISPKSNRRRVSLWKIPGLVGRGSPPPNFEMVQKNPPAPQPVTDHNIRPGSLRSRHIPSYKLVVLGDAEARITMLTIKVRLMHFEMVQ